MPGSPSVDASQLRVAIVHPFLIGRGGGEKVIDALAHIFPRAEFFILLLDRATLPSMYDGRIIHTSFLNRGGALAWRHYQHLSPLYDLATARHDLSGFDLVISSGGPGAKTVRVPKGVPHVHYCHSPVRYLWDQYDVWLSRSPAVLRPVFAASVRAQRRRDRAAARKVDAFIANSDYIGARIRRYYDRDSVTVYPPVELSTVAPAQVAGDYFLTVGRLVPGKRTELLIEACNRLGRRLLVAGGGPELMKLRHMAGPSVEVLGRVSDERLAELYAKARAFLFAADEDFGIATVEAQSHGLPAIAYAHGGSLEILSDTASPPDAVFFHEQTAQAIADAILRFESMEGAFDRQAIKHRADRFAPSNFADGILQVVQRVISPT